MQLTKDSDALICVIYKAYLEKRKNNISKDQAKFCGGSDAIHRNLMPQWSFEDVDETCKELHRKGLLDVHYAGNTCYDVNLSDDAIIYMENRFVNGLNSVLDYVHKIKSIVSPLG